VTVEGWWLFELAAKSALVAAAGSVALACLLGISCGVRRLVALVFLACLVLVPVAGWVVPRWEWVFWLPAQEAGAAGPHAVGWSGWLVPCWLAGVGSTRWSGCSRDGW
jgi:hypothetical protein